MTELTIKEKVEELFWSYSDLETDEDCRLNFYKNFVLLICEELLGEPIPNEEEIDPIFKKAQEILKALEWYANC